MLRALIGIAVISGLWLWGSTDAAGDETLFRVIVLGVVLSLFPLVYAWNFSRVPAKIDEEKNKIIKQQNINIDAVRMERKHVLALSILYERGSDLIVEQIRAEQLQDWFARVESWQILTLKYIAYFFSHPDAVSFSFNTFRTTDNFDFRVSDEHNTKLQETAARLEKIKMILDRHRDVWSSITQEKIEEIDKELAVFEAQILASDSDQALDQEHS